MNNNECDASAPNPYQEQQDKCQEFLHYTQELKKFENYKRNVNCVGLKNQLNNIILPKYSVNETIKILDYWYNKRWGSCYYTYGDRIFDTLKTILQFSATVNYGFMEKLNLIMNWKSKSQINYEIGNIYYLTEYCCIAVLAKITNSSYVFTFSQIYNQYDEPIIQTKIYRKHTINKYNSALKPYRRYDEDYDELKNAVLLNGRLGLDLYGEMLKQEQKYKKY